MSDISASLSPSNARSIEVTLGWFTFNLLKALSRSLVAYLQVSVNNVLLKRFGTAEMLGIIFSAMSFKMEVNKFMGSSASVMAVLCRCVLHRC